jgi:glucokinase
MSYLFGVDIGGTTIKIGIVSLDGKIIDKFEIKTNTENNGDNILVDVRDAIYDYLSKNNISHHEVLGIGFGVPGPVCNNVVNRCVNLGWPVKDVKSDFLKLLDWEPSVSCANDANVAALGEMSVCANDNIKSAVMFTLGTGVGGGIILDGKILDGANGAAGELGHLKLDRVHNFKCGCGLTGCLETVASATGVVRLTKKYLETRQSVLSEVKDLSCKAIFDAAKANDDLAIDVVNEVGDYIALAASIVACNVDPEVFIIGGGVSKAGSYLLDIIQEKYRKYVFRPMRETSFVLASLGNDAGMLGAALLAKPLN